MTYASPYRGPYVIVHWPIPSCYFGTALPNPDAVLGIEIHLRVRIYRECRVPRIQIANGESTILRGCMAVGQNLIAQRGIPCLLPPAFAKADEEALIGAHSIKHR